MSTRDIFITGHGGYKEAKGNVTVPEKCEVRFYVTHGCKMDAGKLRDMLKRGTIKCHDGDAGTDGPVEVFPELSSVPNMTLQPLNASSSVDVDRTCFIEGKATLVGRGIQPRLLVPWSKVRLDEHDVRLTLEWIMRKVLKHRKALKNEGYESFRFHWLCCRSIIEPKKKPPAPVAAPKPKPPADPGDPFGDVDLVVW